MEFVRLAHYPFLPEAREAVREAGPGLDAVLRAPPYQAVRARAAQRVEGALGDGFPAAQPLDERAGLLELLSVPVARMLVVALGEKAVVARYAAAEARLVRERLLRDADAESVARAAAALAIAAEPAGGAAAGGEGGGGEAAAWRLHFSAYIALAPTHEARWKLIRRPLAGGHLRLGLADMAGLVEEALRRRIQADLEAEWGKPLPPELKDALAPSVAALAPRLEEAREAWSQGDFGPVQPELFPPCIKEVFEALKRSENVPHHGRFAFATFLHTVGWSSEQILDYLAATPNFDREKSRYQIEHVTGGKSVQAYTPPGCGTMQTNGVCPLAKRDAVCFTVKHPLNYYRKQLRRRQRDEEAAAEALARQKAPSPAQPPSPPNAPSPREAPRA